MPTRSRKHVLAELRRIAVTIDGEGGEGGDGRRWVRPRDVVRALGEPGSVTYVAKWPAKRGVQRLELRGPRCRRVPRGRAVYYLLSDCERVIREGRIIRRWSDAELERVRDMVGVVPRDEIARRLGRSVSSLRSAMHAHGIRPAQEMPRRHRLLTGGQLARMLRHSEQVIYLWRGQGLPVAREEGGHRGWRLYDLGQVRAWLLTQPRKLMHLHPDVLDMLKIDLAKVEEEQESRKAAEQQIPHSLGPSAPDPSAPFQEAA